MSCDIYVIGEIFKKVRCANKVLTSYRIQRLGEMLRSNLDHFSKVFTYVSQNIIHRL